MRGFLSLITAASLLGCASLVGADFSDSPPAPTESDGGTPSMQPNQPMPNSPATPDAGEPCSSCEAGTPWPHSNAAALGDMPRGGADVDVNEASFATDADCAVSPLLGACELRAQPVGPPACVCRAGSYRIRRLTVTGAPALVLFAAREVTIGTVDIAATQDGSGPGANLAGSTGNEALVPLLGGKPSSSCSTDKGGGGGALQISAGVKITITGDLQAGGGGGKSSTACGPDGGQGGSILLEAPRVHLTATSQVLANGGGGGGGAFWRGSESFVGSPGHDARSEGRVAARGGGGRTNLGCNLHGFSSGGQGGSGATQDAPATMGEPAVRKSCLPELGITKGGDGGELGRVRINVGRGGLVAEGYTSPAPSVSERL